MLARDNSILILLGAVIVFTMVMRIRPCTVVWINQLASYVFPIYVMHGALMSRMIYIPETLNQMLYLMVWLNAISISMIAIVLEFIRRKLLNKPFGWLLKLEMRIIKKVRDRLLAGSKVL